MAIFKCKMCGNTIELERGATAGVCPCCGTKQTFPRLDDDKRANLYDYANHFRRNNDFDKARGIYEQILEEDRTDAEAYWSLVLCRYGIEYVEDPVSHKRIPTVNRAQFTSILADENYKAALQYADKPQKAIYKAEAKVIDEIQKEILEISEKEEPFDVFICYKETDHNGRRTPDSVLANDLYHQLTQEGFKVFSSRITLEDKLGTAYEPYIFAALNSARVMVVLGTRPEYFNAVWVKNEWCRFLTLIKNGEKKLLIPAFRDMDPYDLPEEFSHLQAQDMSKLGFMQDLIRGIKKIISADVPKEQVKEVVAIPGGGNVVPLLKRAFMFLEDGEWQEADGYCEKALDQDPENARAYLGKLMAELHVHKQDDLRNCETPFDDRNNYQKTLRFADPALTAALKGYIVAINGRNESTRLQGIYTGAVSAMESAETEEAYQAAAAEFQTILGFEDANALMNHCLEMAEICHNDGIYADATAKMEKGYYDTAAELFSYIPEWKDAQQQLELCEHRAEEQRTADAAAAKKRKKGLLIGIIAVLICAIVAFFVLLFTVILPNNRYNAAIGIKEAERYEEAITAFEAMDGYKDSAEQIMDCRYALALGLKDEKKYEEAITAFEALEGYKDSAEQIEACRTALKDKEYEAALALMNKKLYEDAIKAFEAMDGYKDSDKQIEACRTALKDIKYNAALALMEASMYQEALTAFEKLDGYKDSAEQIEACMKALKDQGYNEAVALMKSGKYQDAYASFSKMSYKDSADKAQECLFLIQKTKLSGVKKGDTIKFGFYEQDNNSGNGKEEIEWTVLSIEGGNALVISKYALDCRPYQASYSKITWDNSDLRKWLSSTFLNEAFSTKHQELIPTVSNSALSNPKYSTSPGSGTKDKVFLLSTTAAKNYFANDAARKCTPTAYAKARGAAADGGCWWWLRTPGSSQSNAAAVFGDGSIYYHGMAVNSDDVGIRPALWIVLNK